jgi:hypothetical protein
MRFKNLSRKKRRNRDALPKKSADGDSFWNEFDKSLGYSRWKEGTLHEPVGAGG